MPTFKSLTPEEAEILIEKGTEPPFSGEYNTHFEPGVFVCRQCLAPLYESSAKFESSCGWPSFDAALLGAVNQSLDADGIRTEITCANCEGHLGHVFSGEQLTEKNTRYCVNSLSMRFIAAEDCPKQYQTAVFASGCYWGTEYWFAQAKGVIATAVGYAGGQVANPTYQQVCSGSTGHAEAVRVIYDPQTTNYEALVKLFFETHDPTQTDGQGPDKGSQYRSVIFTLNDEQAQFAQQVTDELRSQGVAVHTVIEPLTVFYPERDPHHQHYYRKTGGLPYCHSYTKKFS